jgi:hypothetical protein
MSAVNHMRSQEDSNRPLCLKEMPDNHYWMPMYSKVWRNTTCQKCRKKAGITSLEEEIKADKKIYRAEVLELNKENKELKKEIRKLKLELEIAREAHLSTIMKG